jgi:N-acyl-D-amino-acid deacylase
MTERKGITRRAALAGLGGLAVASQVAHLPDPGQARAEQPREPFAKVPVRGKAGPGLAPFDAVMLKIMDRHGIPGAALAVAKDGRLVLAKGYGWANVYANKPV